MRQSEAEKADIRAAYQKLSPLGKAEHIWIYYKWFIILGVVALVIVGATVHRILNRKDPVLYEGWINIAVGSELETTLDRGYLDWAELDAGKQEVRFYRNLFLLKETTTETHQSAYASRVKLMASIEQQSLDLVLMSREGYDILSESGYLLPLTEELAASLPSTARAGVAENTVVLEDNEIEYLLNEAEEHRVVTEQIPNAIDLSAAPRLRDAGFPETVYLGIIANSPRAEQCLDYVRYLFAP